MRRGKAGVHTRGQITAPAWIRQDTEGPGARRVEARVGSRGDVADRDEAPGADRIEHIVGLVGLEPADQAVELPPEDQPAQRMHPPEQGGEVRMLAKAGERPHGEKYTSACGGVAQGNARYFTSP